MLLRSSLQLLVAGSLLIPGHLILGNEEPLPARIEFNRDVRPIVAETCFHCHGPDNKTREANRRLDTRVGALAENDGVKAIVPGNLAQSDVHVRIHSTDKDEKMPPPDSGKKLTARQAAILDKWIEQGAEYQDHWAYIAPARPATEPGASPIDTLIRARLAGLSQSPAADRRTLLRRLSLDLIGLPPKPEEVEEFIRDAAPDAYEKRVDALLASPQYGERMAIPWLDVVRFADTIGYHSDNPRNIWPYRDYVINAFNSNKRFDQFTIEQLAGDLLPESSQEQKIASGFNRLLLSTEEGGAQAKDYESRMLTDRVRAVSTVWLGQTIGCAQCHDHKFDPITARDFYSLGAFFADIEEPIIGKRESGMPVLNPEQKAKSEALTAQIAGLEKEFNEPHPELVAAQETWEKGIAEQLARDAAWTVLEPAQAVSEKANFALLIEPGGIIRSTREAGKAENDGSDSYRITVNIPTKGVTGFRIEALKGNAPGVGGSGNGNFVLNEVTIEQPEPSPVKLSAASASFEQPGFSAKNAIDGIADKKENGWAVLGATGVDQALSIETAEPLGEPGTLTFVLKFGWGDNHVINTLRLSATTLPHPVAVREILPKEIVAIFKSDPATRTATQSAALTAYFKQTAPELLALRTQLEALRKEKKEFDASVPTSLISIHTNSPRKVRILPRGDWMNETGEIVEPALPHYLPQPAFEADKKLTRLDLAQWIVSKENPLTARVFVNRLWKQFFGIGLSKVLDDLGSQGESPVQAELLDWLASEFMESGWNVKHMVRLVVTSQTYQQVSTASKELQKRDPYNRELARQSRWRLDAEFVRDNALAVAGLLENPLKVGGPSAKPYQPEGYWENLNFPTRAYQADTGASQYRRGLYTWWQRSYPHPSLISFDAPSREECTAERVRSNIPQQALVLLNDPSYVEASRAFAGRILKECDGDVSLRITWAFRQALNRAPEQDEIALLSELLTKNRALYQDDLKSAEALLKIGLSTEPAGIDRAELAAWTQVARVLLNLHETITRS
ncbi:MAG: Protein of unknown function (DUF1553)/Protein of unknown function (DUF1549)/Planctomycete [Chthoniobacteraceae bacterium]|nr:Protein of unknown function (DUF1553)/Protein of unknown function (DUF1549)/Planctomycete [Chthoniobacteraceae bacterium]